MMKADSRLGRTGMTGSSMGIDSLENAVAALEEILRIKDMKKPLEEWGLQTIEKAKFKNVDQCVREIYKEYNLS